MTSVYPNGIDNTTTLPTVIDDITEVTADTVNRLRDTLLLIETELGIKPRGASSSVSTRLDDFDTSIANLNTSITNVLTIVDGYLATLSGESLNATDPTSSHFHRFDTGLSQYGSTTKITDVLVNMNDTLKYLAPAQPASMASLPLDTAITFYTGNLSDQSTDSPPAAYGSGAGPGTNVNYIITNNIFTLVTHTTGFSDADKGILTLLINGTPSPLSQTFDLGAAFDPTFATTAQGSTYAGGAGIPHTVTGGQITISSVQQFNGFPLWQRGAAVINVTLGTFSGPTFVITPGSGFNPGFNTFQFLHTVNGVQRFSNQISVWYDDRGTVRPSVPTPGLTIGTGTPIKHLSGVNYLSAGCVLIVSCGPITNPFKNTFIDPPITYTFGSGMGISTGASNLSDSALTGFSNPPLFNQPISISKQFSITNANQQNVVTTSSNVSTTSATVAVAYTTPYAETFTGTSISQNMLINTYGNVSTDIVELFVDENYRLPANNYTTAPSPITAQWNSTSLLANGNAQCYGNALVFPGTNFTTGFSPTQTANYSAFSGNQVYYRAFRDVSNPHSNGILQILGMTLPDFASAGDPAYTGAPNIKVELKIPSITGWKDLGLAFNPATFNTNILLDGDGCRSPSSPITANKFGWSMGAGSTGNPGAGNMYIVRITFFNRSKAITGLSEVGW